MRSTTFDNNPFVAETGNKEILNLLLSKGANAAVYDKDGETPYDTAYKTNELEKWDRVSYDFLRLLKAAQTLQPLKIMDKLIDGIVAIDLHPDESNLGCLSILSDAYCDDLSYIFSVIMEFVTPPSRYQTFYL